MRGRLTDAERAYREILDRKPETTAAWVGLTRVYLVLNWESEHPERALETARKAVELAPKDADAQAALSLALDSANKVDDAIRAAEEAVTLDEKSVLARIARLGTLAYNPSPTATLDIDAEAALALAPKSPDVYRAIGGAHLNLGDAGRSLVAYRKAQSLAPEDPHAAAAVVEALMMLGRAPEAEIEARRALSVAPDDVRLTSLLAFDLVRMLRLDEAGSLLDRLDKSAPGLATVVALRSRIESARGNVKKGIEFLREGLKKAPDSRVLRYELLWALASISSCSEVEEIASGLAAQSPKQSLPFVALGMARACKGDGTRALEQYRKALALNPHNWQALQLGALTLDGQGRTDEAEDFYSRLMMASPNKADVRIMTTDGETTLVALEDWSADVFANPYSVPTRLGRAWQLLDFGYDAEALADAREIQRLVPGHIEATAIEGAVLAMRGQHRAALEKLQPQIDRDTDRTPALKYAALARTSLGEYAAAARLMLAYRESKESAGVSASHLDDLDYIIDILDSGFGTTEKVIAQSIAATSKELPSLALKVEFGAVSDEISSGRNMTVTFTMPVTASVTQLNAYLNDVLWLAVVDSVEIEPMLVGASVVMRQPGKPDVVVRMNRIASLRFLLGIRHPRSQSGDAAAYRSVDATKPPYQAALGAFKNLEKAARQIKTAEATPARLAEIWIERGTPVIQDAEERARVSFGLFVSPTLNLTPPADLLAVYRPADKTLYYRRVSRAPLLAETMAAMEYGRALLAADPYKTDIDGQCSVLSAPQCSQAKDNIYADAYLFAEAGLPELSAGGLVRWDDYLKGANRHAFFAVDYLPTEEWTFGAVIKAFRPLVPTQTIPSLLKGPSGDAIDNLLSLQRVDHPFGSELLAGFTGGLGGNWQQLDIENLDTSSIYRMTVGIVGFGFFRGWNSRLSAQYALYRLIGGTSTVTAMRIRGRASTNADRMRYILGRIPGVIETTEQLTGNPNLRTYVGPRGERILLRAISDEGYMTLVIASDETAANAALGALSAP